MCACEPGYELEADQRNCRGVSLSGCENLMLKVLSYYYYCLTNYYKMRVTYLKLIYTQISMNVRPTMEVALKSVSIDSVVISVDAGMVMISTLTTALAMARFVLFYLQTDN